MKIYLERKNFDKLKPYLDGKKLTLHGLRKINELLQDIMQNEEMMVKILRNERKRGYRIVEIDDASVENVAAFAHKINAKTEDVIKTLLTLLITASEKQNTENNEMITVSVRIPQDVVKQLLSYDWRKEFEELIVLGDEEIWQKIMLVKCQQKDNHVFYWGVEKQLLEKIKKYFNNKNIENILCRVLTYLVK